MDRGGTIIWKTECNVACFRRNSCAGNYSFKRIFNDAADKTSEIAERNGVYSGGDFNRSVLSESRAAERNRRLGVRIGHRLRLSRFPQENISEFHRSKAKGSNL